jgi:hypothetical protein
MAQSLQADFVWLAINSRTKDGNEMLRMMHSHGYWGPQYATSVKQAIATIERDLPLVVCIAIVNQRGMLMYCACFACNWHWLIGSSEALPFMRLISHLYPCQGFKEATIELDDRPTEHRVYFRNIKLCALELFQKPQFAGMSATLCAKAVCAVCAQARFSSCSAFGLVMKCRKVNTLYAACCRGYAVHAYGEAAQWAPRV